MRHLLVIISIWFLSVSVHSQEKFREKPTLVPLRFPGGMQSFVIDTRGKIHVADTLWKKTADDGKGRELFVGQGPSLSSSRIEVAREGAALSHVIAVGNESKASGWEILGRFALDSSGPPPEQTMIATLAADGRISSETRCHAGNCISVTPDYCAQVLKVSGAPSFERLSENLMLCEATQTAWTKSLTESEMRSTLKNVHLANMGKLRQSLLYDHAFKNWSGGLKAYREIEIGAKKTAPGAKNAETSNLRVLNAVVYLCGQHTASGAFAPVSLENSAEPPATQARPAAVE